MFDGNMREQVDRGLEPIGEALKKIGVTADIVTFTGIVMAAAAAVVIATGHLGAGLILMILTGVPDALDGAVAKASGTSSLRGAYLDSVSDRLTDILLFGGVAWYLSDTREGQLHMLPVAVMGVALMISYQRAKAESLGFDAKGGLMERAERFIALGIGLFFGMFNSDLLVVVLWVMFALTAVTALQRFAKVWKQASVGRPIPPARANQRKARDARRRKGREPLAARVRKSSDR